MYCGHKTELFLDNLCEQESDNSGDHKQLFLQQWQEDIRVNLANFDKMFIANYLCFRTFAEKTGRKFADYFDKSIDEYDHPHPGIRMYYSYIHYSYWIGRFRDFGEDTMIILGSGSDAVI